MVGAGVGIEDGDVGLAEESWDAADCRSMAGSPKKIQVRRTSGSETPDLAWRMALPRESDGLDLRAWRKAWFMDACGG